MTDLRKIVELNLIDGVLVGTDDQGNEVHLLALDGDEPIDPLPPTDPDDQEPTEPAPDPPVEQGASFNVPGELWIQGSGGEFTLRGSWYKDEESGDFVMARINGDQETIIDEDQENSRLRFWVDGDNLVIDFHNGQWNVTGNGPLWFVPLGAGQPRSGLSLFRTGFGHIYDESKNNYYPARLKWGAISWHPHVNRAVRFHYANPVTVGTGPGGLISLQNQEGVVAPDNPVGGFDVDGGCGLGGEIGLSNPFRVATE
jgi:hypothetical protein